MKMDRMYRYKAILLLITTSIPSYGFPVVRVVEIKASLIWINLTIFKAFALCQAVLNIDRVSNASLSINRLHHFAEYQSSPTLRWVSIVSNASLSINRLQRFAEYQSSPTLCWVSIVSNASLSISRLQRFADCQSSPTLRWVSNIDRASDCWVSNIDRAYVCWVSNIDRVSDDSLSIGYQSRRPIRWHLSRLLSIKRWPRIVYRSRLRL